MTMFEFVNRIRSLYNIGQDRLPEFRDEDWLSFRNDPLRYLINYADAIQIAAILREMEFRQDEYLIENLWKAKPR